MADLIQLAETLLDAGPYRVEKTPRRIRILFGQRFIVDTTEPTFIWEHSYYPQYYIKASPDQHDHDFTLKDISKIRNGDAWLCSISSKSPSNNNASAGSSLPVAETSRAVRFTQGPLAGLLKIEFGQMDQWFEEETPIYVHPKDPYKRVDILPSTRKMAVEIDGVVVASTEFGAQAAGAASVGTVMHLYETTLPVRFYMPKTMIDWSVMSESRTTSLCPYKGEANYYNATVNGKEHRNIAWWYRYPVPESAAVAGMVCFYNEKVDIVLDGKRQDRPKTKFA